MPRSITADALPILDLPGRATAAAVEVDGRIVEVPSPFPSPADWRDVWIYFLMVDRFNNPVAPPARSPWDGSHGGFQGGTLEGVRAQLDYLHRLGVGAIWLSPVLKNCQFDEGTYHGYGIQDFLAVEPRFTSDPQRAREDLAFADSELRRLVDDAHARGIYVILDVVLNHTGDVFAYLDGGSIARFAEHELPVRWRDADGTPRPDWARAPADPPADAAVWPTELRRDEYFRRQGNAFDGSEVREHAGDFFSLKELVTDVREGSRHPVRNSLISAYQAAIAHYDVDGYRIDTLKFVEPEFALVFGNAMREYGLSIGKRNFFTFGEVYDDEDKIARFIGRAAGTAGDLVGVDAALDFPLFYKLPGVAKALPGARPSDVVGMYEHRKQVQRNVVSSHGEASRFFVTFLDNHDQHGRFRYVDPGDPGRFDHQVTLGLTCLFTLQGIPCLYYGTEQGLHGSGPDLEAVRESLWGKPGAFDADAPFARACAELGRVRRRQPALRYGRQYFRPLSGDGRNFGISTFEGGVLAFSRILNHREVLVVANTDTARPWTGRVIVDHELNEVDAKYVSLFSNRDPVPPDPVVDHPEGGVEIREVDGRVSTGPARSVGVSLAPMEIQVLAKEP